jgi:branched-chain amino acid transport system ATP-binding protein
MKCPSASHPSLLINIYVVLREIRARGTTIFFVEQNVRGSLEEADRACIMKTGRIVLSANVAELREKGRIKKAYFGV